MKKLLLVTALVFPLIGYSQPNNDEGKMVGGWRVFASDKDVTSVLRSKDNFADMDLFCDKSHMEISVYLKKKPEDGELAHFDVVIDGQTVSDEGWLSNHRTRSTTVKTENAAFIKKLSDHKEITFSYTLANQPKRDVVFDLSELETVMNNANQVCQLDLSKYE